MPSKAELAAAAFSELQRTKARELIARIRSGERIPLAETVEFLSSSGQVLTSQNVAKEKTVKPTDVDFF